MHGRSTLQKTENVSQLDLFENITYTSDANNVIEEDTVDNGINATEVSDSNKKGRCGLLPLTPKRILLLTTGAAVAAYVGYSVFRRF